MLKLLNNLFRNLFLMLVSAKDYGLILRSSISTLSIASRGVVDAKEESKEILQMSVWVSKFHKQDFNIARFPLAHFLVRNTLPDGASIRCHEADAVPLD